MNLARTVSPLSLLPLLSLAGLTACGPAEKPMHEPAPEAPVVEPEAPAQPEVPATLPVPMGAKVSFGSPADGADIVAPANADGTVQVAVAMLAEGIKVEPAGALVAGSGHHHILIDTVPVAPGVAVGSDESHLHFGKGQTEAQLNLKPGPHTLMLQFADGAHRSYGPALATTIKIRVSGAGLAEAPAAAPAPAAPAPEPAAH